MGIYLPNMDMPTEGTVIAIYKLNGQFYASVHGTELCHLVPVPPHGDLIDYEFCMKNYGLFHDDDGNPVYAVRMRDINSAPTIICRGVYGNG